MTVQDLLMHLTRIFFIGLSIVTLISYLRDKTTIRRTIFLMFLALSASLWTQLIQAILGVDTPWISKVSQIAICAQPLLMLHLVQYFQSVPPLLYRGSIVGMIISWVAVVSSGTTLSPLVIVLIIIYFVIVDGFASIAFIRGAFSTVGVVRRRLQFTAVGAALLALVLGLGGVNAVFPAARAVTLSLIQFLSVSCAIAYYLGFAPPRWLREAWQHFELRNYLQQIHSISNRTSAELFNQLNIAVHRVMGTGVIAINIALWEKETRTLVPQDPSILWKFPLEQLNKHFESIWRQQEAKVIYKTSELEPELKSILATLKSEMILIVPIVTYDTPLGLLMVELENSSLFVEDELRLLTIFAQETAILLQHYAMLETSKHYAEDLEVKVKERTLELERLNEELKLLAYVTTHDLQEPLRTISSHLQLIEMRYSTGLDETARELFGYVIDGAAHMKELIQDILAYSRVESRSANLKVFECQTVLNDVCTALEATITAADAVITHDPLPRIKADRRLIVQVFQNLLSNAIKYRATHRPEIHIGVTKKDREWEFSFRDNGIGIEAEYLERIFIIFERLHHRTEYQGTGIGLALCKKAIELHHGRIWAESQYGEGTTFRFTLPIYNDV